MHELSLVYGIVEAVEKAATEAHAVRVVSVKLQVGALAGVVKDALLFCYDIAAEGTLLAGSRLDVEEVPLSVYCQPCGKTVVSPSIQQFCCPECDTPSGDIRHGRELDIVSVELEVE
ncbi:[NiFe] hydrogenase nickel incorporation protein HypA [Acidisarcina polymorpha]|uniref:Hydrogenase maturation factor HypA n=1 Tax=Acidisarcina polymorpha TaxID=2211140 RepID=A0A2Z5FSN4_9BACT|nr:hydrogenase maturation nickel metallochaperone HypA [Acidisarcina polymorpha]AXC09477.1 [NiFe] hydrogenase nickel incorporation protein HypA [Acidisarcina polymorpha]